MSTNRERAFFHDEAFDGNCPTCGQTYHAPGHISDAEAVTAQAARIRDLVSENVKLTRANEELKAKLALVTPADIKEAIGNIETYADEHGATIDPAVIDRLEKFGAALRNLREP